VTTPRAIQQNLKVLSRSAQLVVLASPPHEPAGARPALPV